MPPPVRIALVPDGSRILDPGLVEMRARIVKAVLAVTSLVVTAMAGGASFRSF